MKTSLAKGGKPMKASLTKGGKGAGSSKDRKKGKVRKGILKKSQLAKLGEMTLSQKCKMAAESAETAEEAASNLKDMLSKQEHSRVWSKHNVALKGKSAKERKEFDKLSKGEKGQQAALFMIKSSVPKFMQVQESLQQSHTLNKKEEWLSEMMEKFGELSSGNMWNLEGLLPGKILGPGMCGTTVTKAMSPRMCSSKGKEKPPKLKSMSPLLRKRSNGMTSGTGMVPATWEKSRCGGREKVRERL